MTGNYMKTYNQDIMCPEAEVISDLKGHVQPLNLAIHASGRAVIFLFWTFPFKAFCFKLFHK